MLFPLLKLLTPRLSQSKPRSSKLTLSDIILSAIFSAPSVVLDKCERVKVYLAKDLATDIVSSMVSELNISYLLDDDDNYAVFYFFY